MPGETYSAGTIFLQVVPVFRNVQDKIRSQVKGINKVIGDDLEKGGDEAGDRAGKAIGQGLEREISKSSKKATGELETTLRKTVADISKNLDPIQLKFESNEATARVKKLKEEIAGFQRQLDEGLNPRGLEKMAAKLQIINAEVGDLDQGLSDVAKHDFVKVQASLGGLQKKLEDVQRAAEIQVRFDDRDAQRAMGAFENKMKVMAKRAAKALGEPIDRELRELKARLESFDNLRIGVDISDEDAKAELKLLQLKAVELSKRRISIQVDADAGAAAVELLALDTIVKTINGKKVRVSVDVDDGAALGKLAALKAAMIGGLGGDNASNAFRSFNAVLLAAVTIIPALIPMIAALAGGMLALGPIALAAGAGIGAMVIGFSGISTAVQAMGQKTKKNAADMASAAASVKAALYGVRDAQRAVGDAERTAARTAVDSARAVAQARQSAAQAISSALESQRQAQESYADSIISVRDAERSLAEARTAQKQAQQSTGNQIADNKLAIRQAVLGAFDATTTLNAVMADGSSTKYDKEQAKLAFDQAQQQLKELRQQQTQLAKDKKKQDREGIDGSDAVRQAQEAVNKAIQSEKDARIALGIASKAVDLARINGAQAVQQAELQQSRSAADGQRNIARAQEQLRRAQEGYAAALKKSDDIGSSADQNLRAAMKNLGPAGRKFARFIYQLQQGFYQIRGDIQAAMLPPIQHAVQEMLTKYGPKLRGFFTVLGGLGGKFIARFVRSFGDPAWQGFFKQMALFGPKLFKQFGTTFLIWLKIFARLMTVSAPFSLILSKGLLGIARALNQWLASKKGTDAMNGFLAYAYKVGPAVVQFLADFVLAATNLVKALAPWGAGVLAILDGVFKLIAKIPTRVLELIAVSIIATVIAFQVAVGVIALFLGGMAVFATEIGAAIFIGVALTLVIVALFIRFKFLRNILGLVVKVVILYIKLWFDLYKIYFKVALAVVEFIAKTLHLKQVAEAVWGFLKKYGEIVFKAIVGFLGDVGDAAVDLWNNLQPVFSAIGSLFDWLWQHVIKPVLGLIIDAFIGLAKIVRWYWNAFIWPVLDLFIHIITKLWQKAFKPAVEFMFTRWGWLAKGIHKAWKVLIEPALSAFGGAINWLWKKAFKPAIDFIEGYFKGLGQAMKFVYDHTIKPVIDAFVDAMGGPDGLKSKFHTVVEGIKTIWGGLKEALTAPIRFVMGTVVNKGLIGGFNKIANFVGSKPMEEIHVKALGFAKGGVLPGYTPGRDPHRFVSPTGGRLELSGGEAIMRPEWTKAVGPGFVKAMNAIAANGGVGGVQRAMGFASGGVFQNPDAKVSMNGKSIAAIAAAQILLAEKLNRRKYYLMQGGFGGDHIAASGTSHNYPGVGDVSTPTGVTFADQTMLRRVGFAGWARNIAGAMSVGSGQHVHSVSRFSPGTMMSPQIGEYLAGQNGLNGGPDVGKRPPILPGIAAMLSNFNLAEIAKDAAGGHHGINFGLPGWLVSIAKNPFKFFEHKITDPLAKVADRFNNSDLLHEVASVPGALVKAIAHKALDIIPGAGSLLNKAASHDFNPGHAIAGALGFADGGVLPYNGTMKYDAGGYIPPGLTSVINLTGKPEPVFTHSQFEDMGGRGAGWSYSPTFYEAHDPHEVIDDLEFTMRKFGRSSGRGPNAKGGGRG